MEMAVKTMKGQREAQGGGAGSSFLVVGIMGERRPLAPFLHGFLGALPHGDGIHGEAKTWLLAAAIRGWRSPPRVRFPPFI
jgi:hypothetical protein